MLAPSSAVTRIQPPRIPVGCIARAAVQARLRTAVLSQPLVLLCAPAGFGKTTALAQMLPTLPFDTALAWVGADHGESLQRFLSSLCAALAPLSLSWTVSPESLATLALADRGLRQVTDAIVNALEGAAAGRGLVVVEDAHRLEDQRIFELLQLVLDRLPAHWGLVVVSRVEPPMALARQRAHGAMAEFRQTDLQFDGDEIRQLIAAHSGEMKGDIDADSCIEKAKVLMQRTQGWAAGLRLSLEAWRVRAGPGVGALAQRHLFDYLADEVMADMPERLRRFLLRSSVLPELTAQRSAQVSGMAEAGELLEEIERRDLFVTVLHDAPLTLRLHDLFREFLEDRLLRETPDVLVELLLGAAATEPDLLRAVDYQARAGAWLQALGQLLQRWPELLANGEPSSLESLLEKFPPPLWETNPDLWLLKGLAAWPRYDFDMLRDCMRNAVDGYRRDHRPRDVALASAHLCAGLQHAGHFEEGTRILALVNRVELDDEALAFVRYGAACDAIVCGRPQDVVPRMVDMLAALKRLPDPATWQQCPLQAMFIGAPGTASQMGRHAEAVLRLAGEQPNPLRAGARHVRCWQALLAGRIGEADHWLSLADADCRWLGRPRLVQTDNLMTHVLLRALRGDGAACALASQALIDDIRHASPAFRRVHEPAMLFVLARAAWLLRDVEMLADVVAQMGLVRHTDEWPSGRSVHVVCRAMAALLKGHEADLTEAAALLDQVDDAFACHFFAPMAQVRALRAWIAVRQGDLEEAARQLVPVLGAEPDGEAGAIIFAGVPSLLALCAAPWRGRLDAARQDRLRDYVGRAGRACGEPDVTAAVSPQPVSASTSVHLGARAALHHAPLQPLTRRESDVLARLAAGDSNKRIAQHLNLSEHTVKQHVASVLGKLGVESRGQAGAWLRARSPS